MKKKYEVKVGFDFDPNNEVKVEVLVSDSESSKDDDDKTNSSLDWKAVLAVAAGISLLFICVYTAFSGDIAFFNVLIKAVVENFTI